MFTQCAHCETRFRIHSEQLKAAQGLVRCAHCGEVFNALDHLQEEAEEHPATAVSPAEPPVTTTPALADSPPLTPAPPLSFEPLVTAQPPVWHHLASQLLWGVGLLILAALALVQTAWFNRDILLKYDEGRAVLETYCGYTGCSIPPRRALEKLKITERLVASHPSVDGILRITLTFENQAPFYQPFPILQVSLFTGEGELDAQRRFTPDEYTGVPTKSDDQMQPGQQVEVELDVKDPGAHVTGFEFAFF